MADEVVDRDPADQPPVVQNPDERCPRSHHRGRDLDEGALRRIVRHCLDGGVHGLMTTGGTGEFPHLSREERRHVAEIVASEVAGAVPVYAGTAACSTWEAIALIEDGASLLPVGVTAVRGRFVVGDAVDLVGPDGVTIGKGLAEVTSTELQRSARSRGGEPAVHRDTLFLDGGLRGG